jgi:hypothetical protein
MIVPEFGQHESVNERSFPICGAEEKNLSNIVVMLSAFWHIATCCNAA